MANIILIVVKCCGMKTQTTNRLSYFVYEHFCHYPNVTNIVSSRTGGASDGPHRWLNLGLHVGDRDERVLTNRRLLCHAFNIEPAALVIGQQVHGTNVEVITDSDKGKGALTIADAIPATDALITSARGVPLLVTIADCMAVSFLDPVRRVVGLAHAGWKGTVGGIVVKTLVQMCQVYRSRPEEVLVGMSPHIRPCCYEVGDEVLRAIEHAFPSMAKEFIIRTPGGLSTFDLGLANRWQLEQAGIAPRHIEMATMCTSCHTESFYSHRRERGVTGRLGALIMLRE